MTLIRLAEYGPIITNKDSGANIYKLIDEAYQSNSNVIIDCDGIITMATFCAKQIFGMLYLRIGEELFFQKIKIINANPDVQLIIKMGIQSAIEESE